MANRLTSIDSITLQRPDDERAKLAANLADVSTVEGAALTAAIVAGVDDGISSSTVVAGKLDSDDARLPVDDLTDYSFALVDSAGRVGGIVVGQDGHIVDRIRADFGTPHRVDLRQFLELSQSLPNDGTTDASVLLQSAADACNANIAFTGPVQIHVPAGKYKMTTSLSWYSGVGMVGDGRSETIFLPYGGASFIFSPQPTPFDDTSYDDCQFCDFAVDGINQSNATYITGIKGFYMNYMKRVLFENVTVRNTFATGFGVDHLQDSYFVNCVAIGCGRGVPEDTDKTTISGASGFGLGSGGYQWENVTLVNCIASDNALFGFFVEKQSSATYPSDYYSIGYKLIGCWASGNWQGFHDSGTGGAVVSGCVFIGNDVGVGFDLTVLSPAAGYGGVLANNQILANRVGILVGIAYKGPWRIQGNRIASNTEAGIHAPATAKIPNDLRIVDNEITLNGGSGILIEGAGNIVKWLTITNNQIMGNGTDTDQTYRDGVTLAPATTFQYLTVTGNRVYDSQATKTQQNGINLVGDYSDTGTVIRYNDLRSNVTAALANARTTSDATLISDNIGVS